MAEKRKRYSVYGHLRGAKGKKARYSEWLGYVKDYNSVYALERARREYGNNYVVTKVMSAHGR